MMTVIFLVMMNEYQPVMSQQDAVTMTKFQISCAVARKLLTKSTV
jgi:hypothetical protein